MMRLQDVYADAGIWWLPHLLLHEREPNQNISHRVLPRYDEHCAFVRSRPYPTWLWFVEPRMLRPAGCVYLTERREIGVGVLRAHRGKGLARGAITELMRLHPDGRFLANINPANEASIALFRSLGFGGPIQVTLEKP